MHKISLNELDGAKLVSYTDRSSEMAIGGEESEICFCDDCGESAEAPRQNIFSEDFVWHPSERY
jgi:hypothetical protein